MKLDAKNANIEDILDVKCIYSIPDYQRPYSWTKGQIEELLEDIESAMVQDANHFLGTIMLNTSEMEKHGIIEIIDGQQRITTILIMLYVILEKYNLQRFKEQKNIDNRKSILKARLAFTDDDGEIIDDKLILGEANKKFFKEFIVESYNLGNSKKQEIIKSYKQDNLYKYNKAIVDGYNCISKYFDDKIALLSDLKAYEIIKQYQTLLLKKLEIVKIVVEDDADAFLIFETLNDRGLSLTSVDLIKNKLFKNCASNSKFDEIKAMWTDMLNNLDDGNEVKKYIRHYWMSKYDYVTIGNLFKECRKHVENDFIKSKQFIEELKKYSRYYSTIRNPHNGVIENKKLIKALLDMNQLSFDLTHPILISAFRTFDNENDIFKITRLCSNFMIRYISIMKEKPSKIEKKICEVAKALSMENVESLFKELAPDNLFMDKVESLNVNYQSYSTYYMLTEYEESLHTNEPWRTTGRDTITVEHILPQTVKKDEDDGKYWIKQFGSIEECEVWRNRLGNLSLLGTGGQGKAKNKDFEYKKSVYKENTDMFSTKQLLDYDHWNKENLIDRQKKMAGKFVEIFTLDINKIK